MFCITGPFWARQICSRYDAACTLPPLCLLVLDKAAAACFLMEDEVVSCESTEQSCMLTSLAANSWCDLAFMVA